MDAMLLRIANVKRGLETRPHLHIGTLFNARLPRHGLEARVRKGRRRVRHRQRRRPLASLQQSNSKLGAYLLKCVQKCPDIFPTLIVTTSVQAS